MAHLHLSRELLNGAFNGERNLEELVPLVLQHLFDLCPECQRAFDGWRQEGAHTHLEQKTPTQELPFHAESSMKRIRAEQVIALERVRDLAAMPRDLRLEAVEKAPKIYQGAALGNLLIESSRECMPGKPHDSLLFAQLARAVLEHSVLSPLIGELYARAVAYVANAWRVIGRLPEASEVISHSRFLLKVESGSDPSVRAEIDKLEGLIRFYQRRFGAAERLLGRAIRGFKSMGLDQEALRSEIYLGLVYRDLGRSDRAVAVFERLIGCLETQEPDRMLLYVRKNLALSLCDLGRFAEARQELAALGPLFPLFGDDVTRLKALWIEGLVALGMEELDLAVSHFRAVQHGFSQLELTVDEALVSIDLARAYLMQGRAGDVQEIAAKLAPLFTEQESYREAYIALMLFQDAATLSQVSLRLLENLATYLLYFQRDPSFVFQQTS
ncbi:MAG: hypothetical protein K0U98_13550 [Deltaproteobacteria bacterium]|nr:hypothetical protein [Deltaproteobacteria bacterium]